MTYQPGDLVRVLPSCPVIAIRGKGGTFHGTSGSGQPIIDIPRKGRYLVSEEHLAPGHGDETTRPVDDPERVPLADELPPRELAPLPERPAIDWCERPAPKIAVPNPAWTPLEEREPMTNTEPVASAGRGWTEERRQKFRATMAAKREQRENAEGTAAPEPAQLPERRAASTDVAITKPKAERPVVVAIAGRERGTFAPVPLTDGAFDLTRALRALVADGLVEGAPAGQLRPLVELICQWEGVEMERERRA